MGKGFLYGSGGGINKSQIIATIDSGSTVTCSNGTVTKTAIEKDGTWTFKNLDIGTWTLTAEKDGLTTTETVNIDIFQIYYVTMGYFTATIDVTYPEGSTCTCANGETVYTAPDTSGSHTFTVHKTGNWTVSCTDGTDTDSAVVSITTDGQSPSVELRYGYLFKNGNQYESITGGWVDGNSKFDTKTAVSGSTLSIRFTGSGDSGDCYGTTNMIDLTGISTITVTVTGATTDRASLYIAVSKSLSQNWTGGSPWAASGASSNDGDFNWSLDVSSFNGNYYVIVAGGAYGWDTGVTKTANADVTEVRMT